MWLLPPLRDPRRSGRMPGGHAYERELIAAGLTPREILMAGQDASGCLPVDFERQVEIFEGYVAKGYDAPIEEAS